jgi:hypothetical protein
VVLEANAEFVGNFVLPVKSGDAWITIRTSSPDSGLPSCRVSHQAGRRGAPGQAPFTELGAGACGPHRARTTGPFATWSFVRIRAGRAISSRLAMDPALRTPWRWFRIHVVLNHLYVHGDRYVGQKRCIALNAASVTISDSYVAECKGAGQDTQAIGGWNGPGPYTIENNYLEAAGENVMFGGADPAIRDLVADGITVRRNHFTRPLSWRDPIISTPGGLSASAVSGARCRRAAMGTA